MKQLLITLCLCYGLHAMATDIQVSKVKLNRKKALVTFDLQWKNSWKNDRNHDAAWVFVKLELPNGETVHGRLNEKNHNMRVIRYSVKGQVSPSNDGTGAFVEPVSQYRGDIHWQIDLKLDKAVISQLPDAIEARVYALEMVYIPEGGFTLGDPDPEALKYSALYRSDANGKPAGLYEIKSEDQSIDIGAAAGNLFYEVERYPQYRGDQKGQLPPAFPKGVNAFYMMKYELTQGQYVAFLNSIDTDLAQRLSPHTTPRYFESRGSIRLENGTYMAESPNRPCNYITWDDGALFADWSGLRPMTELEYVKAARGPGTPIVHEFPWNTDNKEGLGRYVDLDDELKLREGLNEANLNENNRHEYGASYYWVMDLAGSLWEKCVSIGHPIGRAYRGEHGDGIISAEGGLPEGWPKGINEEGGYGYRGGGYYEHGKKPGAYNPHSPIAYRPYAAWSGGKRSIAYSQRYVRTAKR